MIWIGLATPVVVFVVGFRVLTSDSRRAIRRLSERLGITPVPLESMIDQLGKTAGNEYLRYRSGRMKRICRTPPGAAHLAGRDCRRQRKKPALLVSPDAKSAFSGADYRGADPPRRKGFCASWTRM